MKKNNTKIKISTIQKEAIEGLEEYVNKIKKEKMNFILIVSDHTVGEIKQISNIHDNFHLYGLLKGLAHQREIYTIEQRMNPNQIVDLQRGLIDEMMVKFGNK